MEGATTADARPKGRIQTAIDAFRRDKGFWAMIATQFQGAFIDNALKFIIIYSMKDILDATHWSLEWRAFAEQRSTAIAGVLFAIPFLLFPGFAGAVGDRYSKRTVTIATKYWEVGVMLFGVVAFGIRSPILIWAMLFMMTTQSTFFSPAKYGILPESLPESRLSWANGVMAMMTLLAAITGTAIAGPLVDALGGRIYLTQIPLILISLVGLATSYHVARVPAADPGRRIPLNPWADLWKYFRLFWRDRPLYVTMWGITFFWFAGALLQLNIAEFGMSMNQTKTQNSLLQGFLALGIGIGSMGAGIASGRKIEVGLVPIGALGLTIFSALLGLPRLPYAACAFFLFMLGFSSGFYDVPLAAMLQQRSPKDVKAGMIAASNFVNFAGIGFGALLFMVLFGSLGLSPHTIFVIASAITVVVSLYVFVLMPMALVRFGLWVLSHTLYRLRVLRPENVPERDGALLVANYTSLIDTLAITAAIDRPIRFLLSPEAFDSRWGRRLAKATGVIPLRGGEGLRASLDVAIAAIRQGELVGMLSDGEAVCDGQAVSLRDCLGVLQEATGAPVIPVHLDRMWNNVWSLENGRFSWKWPREIRYCLTVSFGEAAPSKASPFEVRQGIQALGTEAYMTRPLQQPMLHRAFVKMARRHPIQMAMADFRFPKFSYAMTLIASIALARKLRRILDEQPMTGVLVPPSVGAALVNVALPLMGKVPVNLNYTASAEAMASSARRCNITQVITSKAFLERLPLEVPGQPIFMEDLSPTITKKDRLVAALLGFLCPVRLLDRLLGAPPGRSKDDVLTIIFSSGSEGDPKGVVLSHFNVASNIEAMIQTFPHSLGDGMMGSLPFFHSFGFTGTLWLPLSAGFRVAFHPNPLEAKNIGAMTRKYACRFLIATPTFCQNYIRRCAPEDFKSLEFVIVGAEKLPARIREAFKAKFGVEPLEGYGTTECSPVVSVNMPDWVAPGFRQTAAKHGTIGHPQPGVSVRVSDPDTGELLGEGETGMLQIKGPNIMQGYLGMPEKSAEVLHDGWYTTGDIAAIDEEGFVTITDRLSRFSKMAGEMVPHGKVEDVLMGLLGLTQQALVVTSTPDEMKGERLVVLHTLTDEQLEELLGKMDQSGLPKLWLPKPSSFYRVAEIPLLGSGKIDIKAVKQQARVLDPGD